ncbi:MAG: CDP-diacylglycerol--glycerol-3-phosphate 3-phosphatidyltransferase [Christensenellales bacterium]
MNIANKLTLIRVALIPIFIAFFYIEIPFSQHFAALVFIAASLTDLFDGRLARRRGIVTNFGKLVDPIADKLLVCSALIMLASENTFTGWFKVLFVPLVIIMVGREFIISGLRLLAAAGGKVLAADMFGKVKTVVQIVAITVVLMQNGIFTGTFFEPWLLYAGIALMCAATALSVLSCVHYFTANKDILKELV